MMKTTYRLALVLLVIFATQRALTRAAIGTAAATTAMQNSAVTEIDSPAGAGSGEPSLSAGPDGRVYLSWVEPIQPKGYALKFAVRSMGGRWSAPRTITQIESSLASSIVALPDGSLAAQWLTKNGTGMHASNVNVSMSRDGGQTWAKAIVPHRDGTQTEHGFVSIIPANGGIAAVWLDGRKMKAGDRGATGHGEAERDRAHTGQHTRGGDHGAGHGPGGHGPALSEEMSLMVTMIGRDGTLGKEVLLDGRVCECCQTSAAPTPDGMAVVYRDRSEKEVRDISIVRFKNGQWSKPQDLSKDAWEINGCPVNGPAISSAGQNVAVAWFTAARDQARVYAKLSADGGATFGPQIVIDDGNPTGRVDIIALPSKNAFVSWVERTPNGTEIRARLVRPDRSKAPAIVVVQTGPNARPTGFPRMKMSGDEVVIAWMDSLNTGKVRTSILKMTGN